MADLTAIPAAPTGGGATGTITATITLGGGAEGFTVAKSDDDSDAFITRITPAGGDRVNNSVTITYKENTGMERNATLTFTTTGGTGTEVKEVLVLRQEAAAPAIAKVTAQNKVTGESAVDFLYATEKLAAASTGTITATITLGGGATGWEAAKDGDTGGVFITSFTDNSGSSAVLEIAYSVNGGVDERSATINITPTGAGGTKGVVFPLVLRQLAAAPTIAAVATTNMVGSSSAMNFDITTEKLAAASTGIISATITLGGGATGWEAAKDGDTGGVFITSFTDNSVSSAVLEIAYSVNGGVDERSATINITPTGAGGTKGVVFPLVLRQEAAAPAIAEVMAQNKVTGESAVDFLYATEKLAAASTGVISATITLGGGATGWEAAKDGDTGGVFITSFTDNSVSSAVLEIAYSVNGGVDERSATINITPTGAGGTKGVVFPLVLRQLAAAPTIAAVTTTNMVGSSSAMNFDITTEKLAAASTGIISATITLGGGATGWEAAKDGDTGGVFITSFTDNSVSSAVLEIAYSVNGGVDERSATINITPTGAGGTKGVVFPLVLRQLAAAPTIAAVTTTNTVGSSSAMNFDITAEKLAAAATGTISATITLGGGATGWEAAKDGDTGNEFITSFTDNSVSSAVLEIAYSVNGGVDERSATINITPTGVGGTKGAVFPLVLRQAAGTSHTFVATPTYTPVLVGGNLTAVGGTISTTFALGGGATGWEATEALDYVELTPSNGNASTPVVVTYDANDTFVARDVVISITTTGPTGVSITDDVSISQEGAQGITVVTVPAVVSDLSTAAGSIDVDVTLSGSATGWSATEAATNPAGFLTLGSASGTGTDVLTIDYAPNTDAALRTATVTLTATGGRGTAQDTVLTISQLGTGPNVVVGAPTGEDFLALPAAGGTIVADVTLTGGALDWDAVAEASNPANFLTVGTKDVTNGEQSIAYAVNAGVSRTGTVTFTTSGGTGAPAVRAIDFRQLGAAPTIDVSTGAFDITMIPASPAGGTGTITATITLGGGAEGWTATKSDDDSDAFISDFTASGDRDNLTLTITYNANTGVGRTATLTIATTGGTGVSATAALVLTQLAAAAPTITVGDVTDADDMATITPTGTNNYSVSSTAQTLTVPIELTAPAVNVDYSPKTGTFLTSVTEQSSPLRYAIVFGENTGVQRAVTLTFEGLDGSDASFTPAVTTEITITQLGAAPTIDVSTSVSDLTMIPASPTGATGTITATITLGGGAEGWTATKSDDDTDAFIESFTPASGDRTNDMLTITYKENTGVERTATLTIATTGGTGAAATADLVITQGAATVLRVPTLLSSFRLYPNPAQGSFVVETEFSDARISIQHVHGGELLRISLQRGRNELDISHLPAGVYVLTLTTSQGSTSTRLIKAE